MNLQFLLVIYYLTLVRKSLVSVQTLIYIHSNIYTLEIFRFSRFLVALICIRVHSPLFFCHFSTTIFHMMFNCRSLCHSSSLFTRDIQIPVTLSLLNCDLFTLSVQILVTAPKIVCGMVTDCATVNIYCLGSRFL